MTDGTSQHIRLHFGMSGSVPLQLYEFVFDEAGCYVLECGAFTPLFGLLRRRHLRRAEQVDRAYTEKGLPGVIAGADTVTWVSWNAVDRLALHTGSRFTRPKLTLESPDRRWTVRLHGVEVDEVSERLAAMCPESVPFSCPTETGLL